ncbi:hypothetical protein GCM10011490_21280 [Pseudoclavibacter endophyticus]|nr:hypothetical protein GCM10011490_21280 [Pseudoclavibacter endophyticus]
MPEPGPEVLTPNVFGVTLSGYSQSSPARALVGPPASGCTVLARALATLRPVRDDAQHKARFGYCRRDSAVENREAGRRDSIAWRSAMTSS